jgi:probable rRNA maturation factor
LIYIQTSRVRLPAPIKDLLIWVAAATPKPLQTHAELTLRFVGTEEGRQLNRDFRSKDYATNVLTFAYSQKPLLADIVICTPVLRREAQEQSKSLAQHCAHLVIHGVLHARGMDHEIDRDAKRMEAAEVRLLRKLGFTNPYLNRD